MVQGSSRLELGPMRGAGRSSEVERSLMVRWVVGSIDRSWGTPIELFLVPRLVQQRLWCVLSCLWDGAYKRTLAVNR